MCVCIYTFIYIYISLNWIIFILHKRTDENSFKSSALTTKSRCALRNMIKIKENCAENPDSVSFKHDSISLGPCYS